MPNQKDIQRSKINGAVMNYEKVRGELLGKEGDVDVLWRVVVAADALAEALETGGDDSLPANEFYARGGGDTRGDGGF